jgi:hypothetical protein
MTLRAVDGFRGLSHGTAGFEALIAFGAEVLIERHDQDPRTAGVGGQGE